MPFYLHAKESDPMTGDAFFTRADAAKALDPQTHKITFVENEQESIEWRTREQDRFISGEYVAVPWSEFTYIRKDHYAHMSAQTPGHIAYTPDAEHGYMNRKKSVRPGKYLQDHYADCFTTAQINAFVAACNASAADLKIATTAEDIIRVYTSANRRGASGPSSCMAYEDHHFSSDVHPVSVYGNSDLQLAWTGESMDQVSARALIRPENKTYVRTYGACETLANILHLNGYRHDSSGFDGALIQLIETENGCNYVMPYLDGDCTYVKETRKNGRRYFQITGRSSGNHYAQNTNGLLLDSDLVTCEDCGDHIDSDDAQTYNGDYYCESCYSDRMATCDHCECRLPSDELQSTDAGAYCESCYENRFENCAVCNDSFTNDNFTRSQTRDRETRNVETLCEDCADTHAYCSECDDFYEVPASDTGVDDRIAADIAFGLLFAGEEVNTSGIYPVRDYAIAESRLDCHCNECKRTIRPEGIPVMFESDEYRDSTAARETDTCNVQHIDTRYRAADADDIPVTIYTNMRYSTNPGYLTPITYRSNPSRYDARHFVASYGEEVFKTDAEHLAYVAHILQAESRNAQPLNWYANGGGYSQSSYYMRQYRNGQWHTLTGLADNVVRFARTFSARESAHAQFVRMAIADRTAVAEWLQANGTAPAVQSLIYYRRCGSYLRPVRWESVLEYGDAIQNVRRFGDYVYIHDSAYRAISAMDRYRDFVIASSAA